MFKQLKEINSRPKPFQFYTAEELWANEHTSKQMLEYHLNETIDLSSRNKGFIERSAEWIVSHFGVNDKTTIADFGCGPGLYTTRLAEKGATVVDGLRPPCGLSSGQSSRSSTLPCHQTSYLERRNEVSFAGAARCLYHITVGNSR